VAAGDIAREGVILLLGNGDGTLYPFSRTTLGPVRAMAAGDFNDDNKADLLIACSPPECNWCSPIAVTNTQAHFLCVLRGNGDGTFGEPQYLLTPGTQACFYDVDAADLNGDGQIDALALDFDYCYSTNGVTRSRRLRLFRNNGAGAFAVNAPTRTIEVAGEGPRAFKLGYIDEQRIGGTNPPGAMLDVVVANRDSGTLDIFRNTGGFTFADPVSLHVGGLPRDIAIGDLDGDGYADLLVVDRNNDAVIALQGNGAGSFNEVGNRFPTGVSPRNVVLADINGDGALDAAVNNRLSEDISLFLGKPGVHGFLVPQNYYPAGITPVSLVAEDFDGDGYPDVAVASLRSHAVHVRLNRRDGTFADETIYPVNFEPAILASDDLNGDGRRDLLVTCLGSSANFGVAAQGSLVALLGDGHGSFQTAVVTALGPQLKRPYWVRLGDLDGDTVRDAVVGGLTGELVAFRGRGDGTFDPGVPLAFNPSGRPLGIALGDFDGDARLDIATSRGLIVLNDYQFFASTNVNTNAGAFVPARTKSFNAGSQAWAVEADDLDGDGMLDLMVALTFVRPDPIGVYFGNGDGTLTAPTIYEGPDVGVVALAATDVDGDGTKDIIVGNRCAATVIVMKGLGNRKFDYREIIKAYSVEDVAVADLNADSKPDILGVGWGVWASINGGTNTLVESQEISSPVTPERSGLFINELMALNTHYHVTNGSTPDWVEIFNNTAFTQNLAGWSLVQFTGDNDTNRWVFPATAAIPPRSHLVVYLKNNSSLLPGLYAPFELSSDGENLLLVRPDGTPEDAVQFPPMPEDVSYARFADGARFFSYNPAPTLGTANRRSANLQPSAERKDPYVGPGASSLGVNARFFDDVAIAYAAVVYRMAGSNLWDEIPLNDDGQHGDKLAGDGYYGALLPELPAGTRVDYYLRVVDLEGQTGSSPNDGENSSKLHQVMVPTPQPSLRLAEAVAANATGLRDERNQFEDWVEILNTAPYAQSLSGLALSRDYFDRASAWNFPANATIGPNQRIVVFCDGDTTQGPLHAGFKLLRSGDRVFLIRSSTWTIIDSLSFGPLPTDTSFGVVGAGTDAQWLAWPTPYGENIPIPSRRYPTAPAPEVFWRYTTSSSGTRTIEMRWMAATNMPMRVEWSSDLFTWQPAAFYPSALGENLFQWSDTGTAVRRFYRLRKMP
jgi:hypothetical protein